MQIRRNLSGMLRRLALAGGLAVFSAAAEPFTFTLTQSQSSLFITGDFDGSPFTPQASGSLTTSYTGTIEVDVTDGVVTFLSGTRIAAANNGNRAPGLGGASGTAPANYGGHVSSFDTDAAVRNTLLDATSAGIPILNGTFPATDISFFFPAVSDTVIDYRYTIIFISSGGSEALTGTYPNAANTNATLVTSGNELVLTIPVDISGSVSALNPDDINYRLRGRLVARAPVPVHTGSLLWTGISGVTNGWNDPLNWAPISRPREWNEVSFADLDATNAPALVDNIVNVSTGVSNLTHAARSNDFHSTRILANTTLSVTGSLAGAAVFIGSGADSGSDAVVHATILGPGRLAVTNPVGVINIRQGSATSGPHRATLDLSGLDNFSAVANQLLIAGDGSSTAAFARPSGTLLLAKTNVLVLSNATTADAIRLGNTSGNGNGADMGILRLGQANLILNDSGITVGSVKGTGLVTFNPAFANSTAVFRDLTGLGRQNIWFLGYNNGNNSSTSSAGAIDFSGGAVDALVTTIYVGRGQSYHANSVASAATGQLAFNKGVIDTTGLEIGPRRSDYGGPARGIVTVGGTGQLIVGGTLRFGLDRLVVATNAPCGGTLNITNGGLVWAQSGIIDGGSGTNSINVTSGHLKLGGQLGRVASLTDRPFDQLSLTNATLTLTLSSSISATNPICSVTNLNIATALTLNVQGAGFGPGQYPLIRYYGSGVGGNGYAAIVIGTLPPRAAGFLSNNVAAKSIDLVVTNVWPIKWNGSPNGNWNIATTANWRHAQTLAATSYLEDTPPGDVVIFDDSALATTTVILTTNLSPTRVDITNVTKLYVLNGPGKLSGSMPLNKNGAGTFILTNSGINDFTGPVTINAGTLRLGLMTNRLPLTANVTLANVAGAAFDLGGQNQTLNTLTGGGSAGGTVILGGGQLTTTASGSFSGAIGGSGMFRKTGTGTQTLGGANFYTGGTYISGTVTLINPNGSGVGTGPVEIAVGTLNVGAGGAGGLAPGQVITNSGGAVSLVFNATNNTALASIHGGVAVSKNNANTVTISSAGTYTGATSLNAGALRISHGAALGVASPGTTIASAVTARLELLGNITVLETLSLAQKGSGDGLVPHVLNVSGTNTLTGAITGVTGGSYWNFESAAGRLIVNGSFTHTPTGNRYLRLFGSGDGDWATDFPAGNSSSARLYKVGSGTWTLAAVNTYNAGTYVYGGTLMVNGQIQSLDTVTVGEADTNTPATLGGAGVISGPVVVNPNGILAPGASLGTLTVNNALTNLGTCLFELNTDTLEHDLVTGLTAVAYGGKLNLVFNGSGTALTNGATFQLFNGASYSGAFAAIIPAAPGPGLSWDTSQLAVNGTLGISAGPDTTPTTLTFAFDGSQLGISWPASHTGWRLEAQTNSVGVGLGNNWFTVPGSTTTNNVFIPFVPANGAAFYRLVYP